MVFFMKKTFILFLFIFLSIINSIFSLEYFRGYFDDKKETSYSIESLLRIRYKNDEKCNENYFHEAQFKDIGVTIFTNIIFSKTFMDKKDCKLHCVITFKDGEKYVLNQDFNRDEIIIDNDRFFLKFNNSYMSYNNKVYSLHVEDNNINLTLTYQITNPPQIFGDGLITLNSKNYMGFSWPIVGAVVKGSLIYKNNQISLSGRGSVGHDFNRVSALNNPRKWRSFWFYNDTYTVHIHTIILTDGTSIDRVSVYKNGQILRNFLNTGLEVKNFVKDINNFYYPKSFEINYKSERADQIKAIITVKDITDKIQAFSTLTPTIHKLASLAVGEMWVYRFWADADIKLVVDGVEERIIISGLGNYVDTDKEQF